MNLNLLGIFSDHFRHNCLKATDTEALLPSVYIQNKRYFASELPQDRAGAPPVAVPVRVPADRQRLLAPTDV